MTGITINVRIVDVTIPPTMGAAIRFMTLAPAPWLQRAGTRPSMIASTVMSFGRTRLTAPCSIAPTSSASVGRRPPCDRHLIVEVAAFAPNHRWAGAELHLGHLPERHLRAVTAADQEPADRGGVIPEVTGIAHLHGIALPALHRGGDLFSTQRQA